jgi:hypothetical protein
MATRRRGAGVISAAAAIAALLEAGVVHATPACAEPLDSNSATFLRDVHGFVPGDDSQLLQLGWRTCGLLDTGFTPITLSNPEVMHTNIPGTPMLSPQQATIVVESALADLCPGAATNGIGVGHPGTNATG